MIHMFSFDTQGKWTTKGMQNTKMLRKASSDSARNVHFYLYPIYPAMLSEDWSEWSNTCFNVVVDQP